MLNRFEKSVKRNIANDLADVKQYGVALTGCTNYVYSTDIYKQFRKYRFEIIDILRDYFQNIDSIKHFCKDDYTDTLFVSGILTGYLPKQTDNPTMLDNLVHLAVDIVAYKL